jgi:glycosyltransferase involved in cell wall biosynthesis
MSIEKPLVSVILCFYNEEKFLAEAVESVIGQTYENWELILVDDGSSDESTAIAKRFASQYRGKIFYKQHPRHYNEGLSASRNLGIASAKGEYIALIDADDVWLANKLEQQLAIFEKHPSVTIILESSLYWYSWKADNKPDVIVPVGVREGVCKPPFLSTHLYPLGTGAAPCPCGIIIHKSVFTKHEFEESFRGIYQMYEDQAFLGKVYLTETIFVSHQCNNKYRQRESSLVSSVYETGKYHNVRSYYLRWFAEQLRYKGCEFREVKRLLKRALVPYDEPMKYKLTVDLPKALKAIAARWLVRLKLIKYSKA